MSKLSRSFHELGLILVTGVTGYVGGRLVRALQLRDCRLRCLARRPEYLAPRVAEDIDIVQGDCLNSHSLSAALDGVDTAHYLVHSMGSGSDFERQDRAAARNSGKTAKATGVARIFYLGGLGSPSDELSVHLRSRHETENILRESGVPVVEFRAGIVVGSGSLSFELIRALVERLPVMVCPQWVRTPTQPIAIEDLIAYLVEALDLPSSTEQIFEIGGGEPVSYRDIMLEYARQRDLRRWLIPIPLLTPRLLMTNRLAKCFALSRCRCLKPSLVPCSTKIKSSRQPDGQMPFHLQHIFSGGVV